MMQKLAVFVAVALALAGCGSYAKNSDVPMGIHSGVGPRSSIPDTATVALVNTPPRAGSPTVQVTGTSCKNKLWEADPSKDNAIALMKRQAAEAGMNRVTQVSVESVSASVLMNCWSAITAKGVAYKG